MGGVDLGRGEGWEWLRIQGYFGLKVQSQALGEQGGMQSFGFGVAMPARHESKPKPQTLRPRQRRGISALDSEPRTLHSRSSGGWAESLKTLAPGTSFKGSCWGLRGFECKASDIALCGLRLDDSRVGIHARKRLALS